MSRRLNVATSQYHDVSTSRRLNVATLVVLPSGTSQRWISTSRRRFYPSLERRDVGSQHRDIGFCFLWNVVTLDPNVATLVAPLSRTSRRWARTLQRFPCLLPRSLSFFALPSHTLSGTPCCDFRPPHRLCPHRSSLTHSSPPPPSRAFITNLGALTLAPVGSH